MTYLKAALGLIAIINWVMGRLDASEKAQALAALWDQKFMKEDADAITRANNARSDVERELVDHPDRLRAPNSDSRT
jgi:hypothetical protein